MAREHVYPVCGPGSKIISFKDQEFKLDEETFSPNTEIYRNKDKSISFRKIINPSSAFFNKIADIIVNRGERVNANQILYDLNDSDLPEGFLDSIGAEEFDGGYIYKNILGYVLYTLTPELWIDVPSTYLPYLNERLEAGTVICIGAKNFNQASGNNYLSELPQVYTEFRFSFGAVDETRPWGRFPFHDTPPDSFDDTDSINDVRLNKTEWATFMFTGTRWVILGSNNWV